MGYRIKTVAEMTGIPRNTLLAWERRYGLLEPDRTDSGYRVYSDEDVALLRRIQTYRNQGYKISEAISLTARPTHRVGEGVQAQETSAAEVREAMKTHLLSFDRAGADEVRQKLALFSFRRCLEEVYLPILRDVGTGWEAGEVTIAQEHFISAFCREQMITMLHSLESGPETGASALLSGYPGEVHELGLLAVAVLLALHGFRVSYLGVDMPQSEIIRLANEQQPDLICQSIIAPRQTSQLIHYAEQLRANVSSDILIVLGGPGVAEVPSHAVGGVLFCHTFEALLTFWEDHHGHVSAREFRQNASA